jgi:hypothetical protein
VYAPSCWERERRSRVTVNNRTCSVADSQPRMAHDNVKCYSTCSTYRTYCVYMVINSSYSPEISTFLHIVHVSPYLIGPISLRSLFPLVLQQGISALSADGPHPSTKDAPVFQTSSELFGRLGMTPLSSRCYEVSVTVRGSSSFVKTQTHSQCIPNPVATSP